MWRNALRYSAVGMEMGIAVGLGYWAGSWLDGKFGTEPYLMMLMLLFGIAAGFKGIIDAARRSMRDAKREEEEEA
jgi:ATP synthase protein I